jgi:hypothetical protein
MSIREHINQQLSSLNESSLRSVLHYIERLPKLPEPSLLTRLAESGLVTMPTRTASEIEFIEPSAPTSPEGLGVGLSEIIVESRR